MAPIRVLFLCTHNSCCSQMAEGFLRHFGRGRYEVFSAGTEPTSVHPLAIEVMSRAGVDIKSHRAKNVAEYQDSSFDFVISVCDKARETCPVFPGPHRLIHWVLTNPAAITGTPAEVRLGFQRLCDDIAGRVRLFALNHTRRTMKSAPPRSHLASA